ncbi:hypothetical protein [[Mycoplasma] imitans]|uniref:hypothetical protein n=1 Tax=[Mycoplasma] imitans TaxID=29560 RepID=UPI0004880E02|nr:hypothetical protein [[Mycoplasma] imitans]
MTKISKTKEFKTEEIKTVEESNKKGLNTPKNHISLGTGTISGRVSNFNLNQTKDGTEFLSFYFLVPNQDGEFKKSSSGDKTYRDSDKNTASYGLNVVLFENKKDKTAFYAFKDLKDGEFIRMTYQIKTKTSKYHDIKREIYLEPLKLVNKYESKKKDFDGKEQKSSDKSKGGLLNK